MNDTNIDLIIKYESGEMNGNETIDFFSQLIKSGLVWKLQGSYGRTADYLIKQNYINEKGEVLNYFEDE